VWRGNPSASGATVPDLNGMPIEERFVPLPNYATIGFHTMDVHGDSARSVVRLSFGHRKS
jgi:hypothetical protein